VDPAPGLVAVVDDPILKEQGIALEIGRVKNCNKNPVAERAIEELGLECLHMSPEGGPLTRMGLALATANMNSRIRKGGLSAREVWTQRDQVSGLQLPIADRQLILSQHHDRVQNHPASSRSKAHVKVPTSEPPLQVGDLVNLKGDRDKTKARDRYLVTSIDGGQCQIRKFTKSQFRSKSYEVRVSDCYQVTPSVLISSGPIRGMENDLSPLPALSSHTHYDSVHNEPHASAPSLPLSDPPAAIVSPPSDFPGTECVNGAPSAPSSATYDLVQQPSSVPCTNNELDHLQDTACSDSSNSVSSPHLQNTASSDSPSSVSSPPRRSSRQRKPPTWQQSDTWVLQ
jgi:hypothetical protein